MSGNFALPMIAVTLLGLGLAAPVQGQVQWDDERNDVEIAYKATGIDGFPTMWTAVGANPEYAYADIVAAGIAAEDETALTFFVKLAGEGNWDAVLGRLLEHRLSFTMEGETYRLVFLVPRSGDSASAFLEVFQGDRWMPLAEYPAVYAELTWIAVVPKTDLRSPLGLPLRPGQSLDGFKVDTATSERNGTAMVWFQYACPNPPDFESPDQCGYKVRDRINRGEELGSYLTKVNPTGGQFVLETPTPIRSSNGLETTMLYQVQANNYGTQTVTVDLEVMDAPNGWRVHMPAGIEVLPGTNLKFPVAISIPFMHDHGQTLQTTIEAKTGDELLSSVQLGVTWPEIPQPAGHHDEIYFHGDESGVWMNTFPGEQLLIRGGDAGIGTQPNNRVQGTAWFAPLSPELGIGLDGDLGRTAHAELTFVSPIARQGDLRFILQLTRADGSFSEVVDVAQANIDLPADQAVPVVFDFNMPQTLDRLVPERGQNIVAVILLYTSPMPGVAVPQDPARAVPYLASDASWMRLPLFDYHDLDLLDGVLSSSSLQLTKLQDAARLANPGKTVVFQYDLENKGNESKTVDWQVLGTKADWGRVIPERSTVQPGQKVAVSLVVDVPEGLGTGDSGDLFLFGSVTGALGDAVMGPAVIQIVTDREVGDDGELAAGLDDGRGAASPSVLVALLALAIAMAWRRRV